MDFLDQPNVRLIAVSVLVAPLLASCSTVEADGEGRGRDAIYSALLSSRMVEEQKTPTAVAFLPLRHFTGLGIVGGLRQDVGRLMDEILRHPLDSEGDEVHLRAAAASLQLAFATVGEPDHDSADPDCQAARFHALRLSPIVLADECDEALVFTQQGGSISRDQLRHAWNGWAVVNRRWIGVLE